ncbi:MAG: hypothetical protein OXC42_09295 [Gammaproteobacteria bacterium]|nr:hypothetical protein [Gammaproteobacteria bacterium]
MQEIQVSVLIIGSLYWHASKLRREWRKEHLSLEAKKHVKVPIRYGRRSKGWGNTYTMVYSMNLVRENQFGQAALVPYKEPVKTFGNLLERAKGLWAVESNKKHSAHVSADNGWGRIALLENPHYPLPDNYRSSWTKHISDEVGYSKVKSGVGEEKAVDESGFLRIPWPESKDSSDLMVNALLTAVTNPTTNINGEYPSSKEIAEAWKQSNNKQFADYFRKNRIHEITTFQDNDIQNWL